MTTERTGGKRRFTYGDQFEPGKTPLLSLLDLCVAYEGDRYDLQKHIRNDFFEGHGKDPSTVDENSTKMAMNCVLSLNGYRLIQLREGGKSYVVTNLTKELLALRDNPTVLHRKFAEHILTELEGLLLARLVENIRARGEQVTLEYIGEELNDLGLKIPPNSTYVSTMRAWLAQAGVFRARGYEVNWDVIYDILKVDSDVIDQLYQLTPEQKHFLLSMVSLSIEEFTPSNKIAKHTKRL